MRERIERLRKLLQTLDGDENGSGTEKTGHSGNLTQCAGDQSDFAESATHGDETSTDLVPRIDGQKRERLRHRIQTVHHNRYGSGSEYAAETGDLVDSDYDRSHFSQGTAHGGKASTDFVPRHCAKRLKRNSDIAKPRHDHKDRTGGEQA